MDLVRIPCWHLGSNDMEQNIDIIVDDKLLQTGNNINRTQTLSQTQNNH